MTFVFYCGVALSIFVVAVTARLAWRRPTAYARVQPRPIVYQNVRVLQDHYEVRELACQAALQRGAGCGHLTTARTRTR
jgi:hypothetical protein